MMDEKGTIIDPQMNIRLTSVRSGKRCRLVGVSSPSFRESGRHSHRKRMRSFRGQFFKHHDKWEKRKENLENWRKEWEERKKEWHESSDRGVTKRLLDLGLTKGCTFKVIQGSSHGPVLVEIRGTRIALGHQLASRVIVQVVED
ncbi:MAG: FeoA family protein [Candidatus Thorarchaeota archaeon SMTZ1-45]